MPKVTTNLMFVAGLYDVTFSPLSQEWIVEHADRGIIDMYIRLNDALKALTAYTGVGEYMFEIRDNPYM